VTHIEDAREVTPVYDRNSRFLNHPSYPVNKVFYH